MSETKAGVEAWTTTLGRCLVTSKENAVCELLIYSCIALRGFVFRVVNVTLLSGLVT